MSGTAIDLTSLNQQIADANALTSGTYTIEITTSFDYAGAITPTALQAGVSLIIDGQDNDIDGGGDAAGLQVFSGTVAIDNLTVADATAQGDDGNFRRS